MASVNKIQTQGQVFDLRDQRIDDNISSADAGKMLSVDAQGKIVTADVPQTGVQSVSLGTGSTNGTVKLTVNGAAGSDVAVKGLGSAAYTASSAYDAAGAGSTAASAVQGNTSSTIKDVQDSITTLSGVVDGKQDEIDGSFVLPNGVTATTQSISGVSDPGDTKVATTAYVMTAIDKVLESSKAMTYEGTVDATHPLPAIHTIGDTYVVAEAGTYAGVVCEPGDLIICHTSGIVDSNSDWNVVHQSGGNVKGPSTSVVNHVATFDSATGNVLKDSGFTIAASVPADAVFTDTTYDNASATVAGVIKCAQGTIAAGVDCSEAVTGYGDYGFRGTIAITGVTNNFFVDLAFGISDSVSGEFAPFAETFNGGIYIYKKSSGATVDALSYRATYNG